MHDPLVVAFTIPRPFPQRSGLGAARNGKAWAVRLHHDHHEPYCSENHCTGQAFPWWKLRSYSKFWRVAGREIYWPPLITVWHAEPGGRDSGEVCKHRRRVWCEVGWEYRRKSTWRWHVHHWQVQVHPAQQLRRWALTRCAWCGGRSTRTRPVNISHSWDGPRGRWWQGAPGLFHEGCSSIEHASRMCLCKVPVTEPGMNYGRCVACGKFRRAGDPPDRADHLLGGLPAGQPMTAEIRGQVEPLWAARRAAKAAAEQAGN